MVSPKLTKLTDETTITTSSSWLQLRYTFSLLFLFVFSTISFSQVLINEVVTSPRQNWSDGGFSDLEPGGTQGSDDEWIELYIAADGINLTGWEITVSDSDTFTGDLTDSGSGAFAVVNYVGTGTFENTVEGDYIVLGNPTGSFTMNNTGLTITLENNSAAIIDQVIIDGTLGTGFSGVSSGVTDESVSRIPNGQTTGDESVDFVKTRATIGTNNSPTGTVLINEVVTDPQQDWEGGGFTNPTPAAGTVSQGTDEWIELYIGTAGLNLTRWEIEVTDGQFFEGDLTSGGAFQTVVYFGSGSFTNTGAGDYLVLGNPQGSESMTNDVYLVIKDANGDVVDDVELGSNDTKSDGTGNNGPDGNASSVDDESVSRLGNASDTDDSSVDLRKVVSTLGTENGILNVFVDDDASDDDGIGTVGDPKKFIQSGVNLALSAGTVTVASGDYSENVTINKALTLNGANQGVAGNDGGRGAESALDVVGAGITATADNVTIDGFQLGTDASTSSITNAISVTGSNISITNNVVYANSIGISGSGASSGVVDISDNLVSMIALEDVNNPTIGSSGIALSSISGSADADVTDNIIANAGIGISTYSLTSSTETIIEGGTITGCTVGMLPLNTNGGGGFSSSELTIQNITMSGFVTDGTVVSPDTETGVYVVTAGGTASDDITITMNNLDISGVGNDASNYSGIVVGDFGADGAGIDATIINCNIHDNENRGIFTRGEDAITTITQTSITNNGFDPTGAAGNFGFSIAVRNGAETTVSNCFFVNPGTQTSSQFDGLSLQSGVGSSLTISQSSFDQNGNGSLAGTVGINLSGNFFNTTDETTISGQVNGNDFTPWLASGTDTDGGTAGFQGDFSSLIVGVSGSQTGSTGRIAEAIDLVDASGTITVNAGTYPESLTISKSVTLNGANQGVAGNDGGRAPESIIEPASAVVGLTVGASDITIDGFQFGMSNTVSNNTTAILNPGFSGLTVDNNRVHANANGIIINGVSSGTVSLSNNYVEMLGLANPLATTDPSLGIGIVNVTGTADVDAVNNDISTATYGIGTFGLTSSAATTEIDGGTLTGCTIGISSSNFDGTSAYSASSLNISNVTMAGFAGPAGTITGASGIPQAGVYAYTTAAATSTDHDLTINVDAVDISEVTAGGTDYAAIYAGDFNNVDPDLEVTDDKGITMTVANSSIYDNLNRGVHSRGADAVVTVNTSTISNNTNAGGVVFAKGTLNINNSFIVLPSSGTTSGVLAQTDGQIAVNSSHFDLNGNAEPSTVLANIQDPAGDETIDVSGSWLTTTDQTTILSLLDESDTDFSPWLGLGTDTNPGAVGFQPDRSSYYVGTGGSQSTGLLDEAHDLLIEGGELTLTTDSYAETLTITKDISLAPESGASIDDAVLNGGNLSVIGNTITINNSLNMTDGVFDIDQEDGDKSDDPVFTLPTTVTGSFGANTHFEGRIESGVSAATSFTFEVGDEGAYRPVELTPTNTTTFQVAHIAGAPPTGAGVTNPTIGSLVGETSTEPAGTIGSVLNFRYWDIDVAGGPPGATEVNLQITSADNATDPATLGMTRFDGSDWVFMTNVSAAGANPYVVTGTTSDFSEFSIYSTDASANPLPVELISFTANKESEQVLLNWATATEINSDYFQVERSNDGINFEKIGEVNSNGNSNQRHNYQFLDNDVESAIHYYRLKMVDFDGSYEYSSTILISPNFSEIDIKIYPNPSAERIHLHGIKEEYVRNVLVYDLNGRLKKSTSLMHGNQLDIADLKSGTYLLRIELVDGSTYQGNIVKL